MMAMGRMLAHVLDTGVDCTGLGRWSWVCVGASEGDNVTITRIVVAYQPCEAETNSKGKRVFEQQQQYFEAK